MSTESFSHIVRVKSLLRILWRTYDAGGQSMGRSHQAVVLETAMALLDDIDCEHIVDSGQLVNDTRSYLSTQIADHYANENQPAKGE
ncbi:MAG: hypothetical protein GY928_00295 [Colwellia sp.]|nr:hypothetical protein [Colwellia sp.]